MVKPITLKGFEETFGASGDPWRTFSDSDEAAKRAAILHALGGAMLGRVLELGAGNGSNSVALVRRSLRLDATEGTAKGTDLTRAAIGDGRRARAIRLPLPASFPGRPTMRSSSPSCSTIFRLATWRRSRATSRARCDRAGG